MAVLVLTDAHVSINSVDLSDHVRSVTLEYEAEILDKSAMGVGSTRTHIAGLLNWSVQVEFNQDFANGEVDSTLFGLMGAAAFPIAIRPVKSSGISTSNPEYQGDAVLESYTPLGNSVGELATTPAQFRAASALVRDTSA